MTDEQLDQLYDDTAAEKLQDDIGDLCTGHPVDEVVSVLLTLLSDTFEDFGAPETAEAMLQLVCTGLKNVSQCVNTSVN